MKTREWKIVQWSVSILLLLSLIVVVFFGGGGMSPPAANGAGFKRSIEGGFMPIFCLLSSMWFFAFGFLMVSCKEVIIQNKKRKQEREQWRRGEPSNWTDTDEKTATAYGIFCLIFSLLLVIRYLQVTKAI